MRARAPPLLEAVTSVPVKIQTISESVSVDIDRENKRAQNMTNRMKN